MCYFVTLGVREEGARILEAERQQRYGLGVAPARNPHLAAIFPLGDKLFWITHGGCSCDLRLDGQSERPEDGTLERERVRYHKKGWSEAKIARALGAKHVVRAPVARGQREDTPLERLTDLLIKLRDAGGGVRIFGHNYSGLVDEEIVSGRRGKHLTVESIYEDGLPEDLVVDVARGAGHASR